MDRPSFEIFFPIYSQEKCPDCAEFIRENNFEFNYKRTTPSNC